MLKREQISPTVWVIYGENQPDVARAFVRFQEYYENAQLKGKKGLVVRDVEKWWKKYRDRDEKELYYTFWTGFNVPGNVILDLLRTSEFRSGFSLKDFLLRPHYYPRWHNEETEFLKLLEDLTIDQISNGYFIGMWRGADQVFEHEVAHAFFATIPAYKAEQMLNIGELPKDLYKEMTQQLISVGYHTDVVLDELQAYLSSYPECLGEIFDTDKFNDYNTAFVETFQRYRNLLKPDSNNG
ncbi:MAG: hypothetical protein KGI25_09760 [Thaumarchaeota archaeon]|nr:hypothetical protein [Nitrososphaerota archaeon]